MNIRLIASDLDGTLLNTQQTISDYTADVLCRAAQTGYYVVPSTGLPHRSPPPPRPPPHPADATPRRVGGPLR